VHTQRWGETFRFNGCPLASNRRLKRRRRVYGRRAVIVEVDQHEIDSLVTQGFLKPGARRDNAAIGAAFTTWLRAQRQYGGGA
jgi:hypothetical protein